MYKKGMRTHKTTEFTQALFHMVDLQIDNAACSRA
jgi:hypothetical protein